MSGVIQNGAPIPPRVPERQMVWSYAGFWWRVLAWIVDTAILGLVLQVFSVATGLGRLRVTFDDAAPAGGDNPVSTIAYTTGFTGVPHWHLHGGGGTIAGVVVTLCYYVLLESSRWQATLGKRICGMRVTDLHGGRINIGRALGRFLGKYVSAFLFGIGYLMVGWTRHKQGLHDKMAGTLVMRRREADPVFTFNEPRA